VTTSICTAVSVSAVFNAKTLPCSHSTRMWQPSNVKRWLSTPAEELYVSCYCMRSRSMI
ncbi:hypothetical protein BX666DRAFT_2015559, partial [Dichotomocladium elegans]